MLSRSNRRSGWEEELGWERSRREVAEAREDAREARNRATRLLDKLKVLEQEKFTLLASQQLLSRRCYELQKLVDSQSNSSDHQEKVSSENLAEKMRVLELENESHLRDEIISLLHADHSTTKAVYSAKIQEFNEFMESAKNKIDSVERVKTDLLSEFRSLSPKLSSRLEELSTCMKQQLLLEKMLRIRKEEEVTRLSFIQKETDTARAKLQSDLAQCKRECSKVTVDSSAYFPD